MAKTSIFVMMLINFTGFILSFECGDQWFVMAGCPAFFPGYNTSFVNTTAATIYNCVYKAKKEPTAKSLVFHKDSQTGQNTCFFYEEIASSCGDSEAGDFGVNRYLFKPYKCQNGGSLTGDKLKCNCPDGYFGPDCTELPTDCVDLKNRGITKRGEYSINLIPNQPPITLTCSYGRTLVMNQDINNDANFTFNRSWAEYRDGFYGKENFWVGLKIMNILTTEKFHNNFVIGANIFDPDQNKEEYLQCQYVVFNIHKENTQFLMTYHYVVFGTYYLGEVLSNLNNSRFSTYDSDNDNMAINCAVKYGGGWWYNQAGTFSRESGQGEFQYECAPANPTGYFWNQCENCSSEVKDISTGKMFNGIVRSVQMYLQ